MSERQVAGGHKAALNNPNVSAEAKENSKQVLDNEFDGGDVESASSKDDSQKNPNNVAGGLKAAIKNPNVSSEKKEELKERLDSKDY